MGPNYSGFDEAVAMVQAGGAREVCSAQQMQEVIRQWSDSHARQQASDTVRAYIQANTGSGERILKSIGPLLAGSQTGHTFTA
jgi:3-deoxy-D-manno-octulosonic-acid transferase